MNSILVHVLTYPCLFGRTCNFTYKRIRHNLTFISFIELLLIERRLWVAFVLETIDVHISTCYMYILFNSLHRIYAMHSILFSLNNNGRFT